MTGSGFGASSMSIGSLIARSGTGSGAEGFTASPAHGARQLYFPCTGSSSPWQDESQLFGEVGDATVVEGEIGEVGEVGAGRCGTWS